MNVVHTINDLKAQLAAFRSSGCSIGLVPTMGALHAGHASLVRRSLMENDVTAVSIFVNPTQFNDKNDLAKYPRTLESDCQLLSTVADEVAATKGCESNIVVFAPSVDEIYPEPDTRHFSYPPTDTVMEGGFRPGHFNGVCQIVSKLFSYAEPTRAYFGEKDYQQIAVIRRMVDDLKLNLQLCPCPIVREADGLALSSRNTLLTPDERQTAVGISQTLFKSVEYAKSHSLAETKQWVVDTINAIEGLEVQYYEIVDGLSLQSLTNWTDADNIVGCITVFCGQIPVRLIDNIRYK